MPRGQKKKAFVGRAKDGDNNNIVVHMYINNHRENKDKIITRKKYDKVTRKHVELKFKEEKHSS